MLFLIVFLEEEGGNVFLGMLKERISLLGGLRIPPVVKCSVKGLFINDWDLRRRLVVGSVWVAAHQANRLWVTAAALEAAQMQPLIS